MHIDARPADNGGVEPDGSIRIHWQAEGYEAIHVYGRFWPADEVRRRATAVADVALTNRTVHDLRRGLRLHFGGTFDIRAPDQAAPERRVAVFFHPPPGTPNPDPDF